MIFSRKSKIERSQSKCKEAFEKYIDPASHSWNNKNTRSMIAYGVKGNMEKTFLEGFEKSEHYRQHKLMSLMSEKVEEPEEPKLENSYQLLSTKSGLIMSYIPMDIAETVFEFGMAFQRNEVDPLHIKHQAQILMNEISEQLGIQSEIDVLTETLGLNVEEE